MYYMECELWKEPIDILRKKQLGATSEMFNDELGFLCSLIRSKRPQKLLELGVARGGTTAVILNALMKIECDCQMVSVDLNRELYHDKEKKTGYILNELKEYLNNGANHKFYLGNTIAEVIDEIGSAIDFVVMDTTHVMPGEVLDFLILLPYLSDDAVVVLHDINLNYVKVLCSKKPLRDFDASHAAIATKVLFSVVKAHKYYNHAVPNIGAFRINNDTAECVEDILFSLNHTWCHMLSPAVLKIYRKKLLEIYDEKLVKFFDDAISMNQDMRDRINLISRGKEELSLLAVKINEKNQKVYIYGAGKYGRKLAHTFSNMGVKIGGFIVSDSHYANQQEDIGESLWKASDFMNSHVIKTVLSFADLVLRKYKKLLNHMMTRQLFPMKESSVFWTALTVNDGEKSKNPRPFVDKNDVSQWHKIWNLL